MTAFPSGFNVMRSGYSVVPRDGSEMTRADDGSPRIRRLWADTRADISFQLDLMSAADWSTISTFYETNKGGLITWTDTFTSITYDALMLEPPVITERQGPWVRVRIVMEGVPQ